MTDVEILKLVDRAPTLADFKRMPEAPQYREVLRRFGSWARAKSLCGGWQGLKSPACCYVLDCGEGVIKIGTCQRKSELLAWPAHVIFTFEGELDDCIALELKMRLKAGPKASVRHIAGPGTYYLRRD